MMSSYFELRPLSAPYQQYQYSVSWPGLGGVHKNRGLLIQWAFETGAYNIAFGGTNGKVLTVNASVFCTHNTDDIIDNVMQDLPDLTTVAFEKRDDAEKFIESAEKYIMWNQLKRKS